MNYIAFVDLEGMAVIDTPGVLSRFAPLTRQKGTGSSVETEAEEEQRSNRVPDRGLALGRLYYNSGGSGLNNKEDSCLPLAKIKYTNALS